MYLIALSNWKFYTSTSSAAFSFKNSVEQLPDGRRDVKGDAGAEADFRGKVDISPIDLTRWMERRYWGEYQGLPLRKTADLRSTFDVYF